MNQSQAQELLIEFGTKYTTILAGDGPGATLVALVDEYASKFATTTTRTTTPVDPTEWTAGANGTCVHFNDGVGDRPVFAKGKCRSCYLRWRSKSADSKRAWACSHTDRAHQAKGLCAACYVKTRQQAVQARGLAHVVNEAFDPEVTNDA